MQCALTVLFCLAAVVLAVLILSLGVLLVLSILLLLVLAVLLILVLVLHRSSPHFRTYYAVFRGKYTEIFTFLKKGYPNADSCVKIKQTGVEWRISYAMPVLHQPGK